LENILVKQICGWVVLVELSVVSGVAERVYHVVTKGVKVYCNINILPSFDKSFNGLSFWL
jgi:hypothetical protein